MKQEVKSKKQDGGVTGNSAGPAFLQDKAERAGRACTSMHVRPTYIEYFWEKHGKVSSCPHPSKKQYRVHNLHNSKIAATILRRSQKSLKPRLSRPSIMYFLSADTRSRHGTLLWTFLPGRQKKTPAKELPHDNCILIIFCYYFYLPNIVEIIFRMV